MKKIGSTMVIIGVLAVLLNFLNRVPTVIAWIYNWGETTAWVIKIGLIVLGVILYFLAYPKTIAESD